MKLKTTENYLLLVDEEAEINYSDYWVYFNDNEEFDGVITKSNLTEKEWYSKLHDRKSYKKVIAYYPLTEEAKELDLPLLPSPFEEINIEDLSEKANGYAYYGKPLGEKYLAFKEGFIEGYKTAQPKQFSLEDVIAFGKKCFYKGFDKSENDDANSFTAWREECSELIQSLSTQQLPKEFIPKYEKRCWCARPVSGGCFECSNLLKTITNSKGKEVVQGKWIF